MTALPIGFPNNRWNKYILLVLWFLFNCFKVSVYHQVGQQRDDVFNPRSGGIVKYVEGIKLGKT